MHVYYKCKVGRKSIRRVYWRLKTSSGNTIINCFYYNYYLHNNVNKLGCGDDNWNNNLPSAHSVDVKSRFKFGEVYRLQIVFERKNRDILEIIIRQ